MAKLRNFQDTARVTGFQTGQQRRRRPEQRTIIPGRDLYPLRTGGRADAGLTAAGLANRRMDLQERLGYAHLGARYAGVQAQREAGALSAGIDPGSLPAMKRPDFGRLTGQTQFGEDVAFSRLTGPQRVRVQRREQQRRALAGAKPNIQARQQRQVQQRQVGAQQRQARGTELKQRNLGRVMNILQQDPRAALQYGISQADFDRYRMTGVLSPNLQKAIGATGPGRIQAELQLPGEDTTRPLNVAAHPLARTPQENQLMGGTIAAIRGESPPGDVNASRSFPVQRALYPYQAQGPAQVSRSVEQRMAGQPRTTPQITGITPEQIAETERSRYATMVAGQMPQAGQQPGQPQQAGGIQRLPSGPVEQAQVNALNLQTEAARMTQPVPLQEGELDNFIGSISGRMGPTNLAVPTITNLFRTIYLGIPALVSGENPMQSRLHEDNAKASIRQLNIPLVVRRARASGITQDVVIPQVVDAIMEGLEMARSTPGMLLGVGAPPFRPEIVRGQVDRLVREAIGEAEQAQMQMQQPVQ